MEGDREKSIRCAQQSQCIAHIIELAKSMNRPPRDFVVRWFDAVSEKTAARSTWEKDVDSFQERVQGRAIEKKKEEEEAKRKRKDLEESYVIKKMKESKKKKENGEEGDEEEDDDDEDEDGEEYEEEEKKVYYKKAPNGKVTEMVPEEGEELREAVPLVVAMKEMTLEERMSMSPGGDIDPLAVLDSLPAALRACFETQDVGKLLELQKTMPSSEFNPALLKCIKAGLWSQPMGEEDDVEEEVDNIVGEQD